MSQSKPNIVVIGGGTGSFTLLSALRPHPVNLTALVNMVDDGGSTGVLRDELGVLPPGDIRQCLVALSTAPQEVRELFNFRFPEGTFAGHSFGNLFLSAVERMTSDFSEAVRMASNVLRTKGSVIPITLDNCNLVLNRDGGELVGEYEIATTDLHGRRPELSLRPAAALNPIAKQAIADADLIVIAPGNLYGSLAPALLVSGVGAALRKTTAKTAFVCNLVNKPQQTNNFSVVDYATEIQRFANGPILDYILYNTAQPSPELLQIYAAEAEYPVTYDSELLDQQPYTSIAGAFLSPNTHQRDERDTRIQRSLIRHDAKAIAKSLLDLL